MILVDAFIGPRMIGQHCRHLIGAYDAHRRMMDHAAGFMKTALERLEPEVAESV